MHLIRQESLISSQCKGIPACVHYSGVSSLRRAFATLMHYAENECVMPIGLHYNEIRALCLTTNAICRTAEIGALLLKCVLIVYIWPEKGVVCYGFNTEWLRRRRLQWTQTSGHEARVLELTDFDEIFTGKCFSWHVTNLGLRPEDFQKVILPPFLDHPNV